MNASLCALLFASSLGVAPGPIQTIRLELGSSWNCGVSEAEAMLVRAEGAAEVMAFSAGYEIIRDPGYYRVGEWMRGSPSEHGILVTGNYSCAPAPGDRLSIHIELQSALSEQAVPWPAVKSETSCEVDADKASIQALPAFKEAFADQLKGLAEAARDRFGALSDSKKADCREQTLVTKELIETGGRLSLAYPVSTELTMELWNSACRESDPKLEPALAEYISRIKAAFIGVGENRALATMLARLRVGSKPPGEAVRLLMNDSVIAYSIEQETAQDSVLGFAVEEGYRLLLKRGEFDALVGALASSDERVLYRVLSWLDGAGVEGRRDGASLLKNAVMAQLYSEDELVQCRAVAALRWVAESEEQWREMVESFLAIEARSENARRTAVEERAAGWQAERRCSGSRCWYLSPEMAARERRRGIL